MNSHLVDQIVNSVLYEGYLLYPYRQSAIKNQQRWNFGVVNPNASTTTEYLAAGDSNTALEVEARFLQPLIRDGIEEAVERRIAIPEFCVKDGPRAQSFAFGEVEGLVEIAITPSTTTARLFKIRSRITNTGASAFVSTHTILALRDGEFVSLLDPAEEFQAAAAECVNADAWPVLVGREPDRNCMLSSPIILYDYPRVAPESPGDLFDGTEIDEILTLRILSLTDEEKDEIRRGDQRGRRILERVEAMTPEQLLALHGTFRGTCPDLKPGDRVRLNPRPGGDVMDVVLAGRIAIVESVKQDLEDRVHVAVVVEDDPGRDLGMMGQPGHRFFFSADELERLA